MRVTTLFAIEQFSEDQNKLMMELDVSKAIILGFSDGTNITMEFALKYPCKVNVLS